MTSPLIAPLAELVQQADTLTRYHRNYPSLERMINVSKYSNERIRAGEWLVRASKGELCALCGEFLEYHAPNRQCLFEPTFFTSHEVKT